MQIKLGTNPTGENVYMVSGTVCKNAEYKEVGTKSTPMATFSLAVGKAKDTTTIFASCKAWRKLAAYARLIEKGDTVIAIGTIEEHEYEGKQYKTLVCEWLNRVGEIGAEAPAYVPSAYASEPTAPKLEEVKTDDDLPF